MRDIDDALPFLMPHVPNCSEPAAFAAIRTAAREICSKAPLWRERDKIQFDDPDGECVTSIGDAEIISIQMAVMDGRPLEPINVSDLDDVAPLWEIEQDCGDPRYITQTTSGKLTIYPFKRGQVSVRLVLKPTLKAMTLPDFLLDQYGDQLGWGAAKYALLAAHDDTGAKPEQAMTWAALYDPFLAGLNTAAAKGTQRSRLRTKGSYF